MKHKSIAKRGRRGLLAACVLLVGASSVMLTSCKDDDVLTGQPSWLGNSIYERLQEDGNYTTVIRLIDDLEQAEVLGHTGSKTLFVADDKAYEEWFRTNTWGVRSYDKLTTAQKKLLLNNSMINSAYLIELMSNAHMEGVIVEGKAMRRTTETGIYDSVYVMPVAEMPQTAVWERYRQRGHSMPLMKDATSAPMIHFLPAYMTANKITSEDLSILTNGVATSANEAWVNGKKVIERDITCKNGYIQKVSGVIESSPNMAEILHQHPQLSLWAHLLDRFSAPYSYAEQTNNDELSREYNRIYNNGEQKDSVFVLRYFSDRAYGSTLTANVAFTKLNWETNNHSTLKYDPGWNHYIYKNTMDYDLHYDAGVLIAPTNEALEAWWNNEGRDLQDNYKVWDSIPEETLAKLIRVNMLENLSACVPSKFSTVLNDAKEQLGITIADIDSCFMGCNGVVYMVNRVFAPAEYSSVAYPALAHESTMNIIYWGIDQRNFLPYLLSMDSKYALLLPSNNALLSYIDPSSYGNGNNLYDDDGNIVGKEETPYLIEFRYDRTKGKDSKVQATRYNCTVDADGNITKRDEAQKEVPQNVINKMMDDLLDQLIIVIPDKSMTLEQYVQQGYNLFKSKGGTLIRVTKDPETGNLAFEGGWQMEHNGKKLVSHEVFEKTNGRSYLLENQMPLGAQKSLYKTLKEHEEYRGFLELLDNSYSDMLIEKMSSYSPADKNNNKNFRLFDNYNYTVFVPTTEAIERLQRQQLLPDTALLNLKEYDEELHLPYESNLDKLCQDEGWYNYEMPKDTVLKHVDKCITNIITDFVRYHVMDHSVAIGMAPDPTMGNNFESMKRNLETGRFFQLTVTYDQQNLSVTDVSGNTRRVVTQDGLYNNICREYWFQGTGTGASLYMGSDAVVHLIQEPLYYEELRPWRQVVTDYLRNAEAEYKRKHNS